MTRATMSRPTPSVAPYNKHDAEEKDQPDAKGKNEELEPHPVLEEPEHLQRSRQKERGTGIPAINRGRPIPGRGGG